MKYRIYLPEYDKYKDDVYEFESKRHSLGLVIEDFAEHFHSNLDGWECSWPVKFCFLDDQNREVKSFLVNREAVPSFYSTEIT